MLSRILPDSISRYFAAAEQHIDPALSQEDHHSPIQSLPPELLQEIFAFSASPFPDPPPILIQEPLPAQFNSTSLYISRVCNQWRSLSFATSEMWSWMSISCPNDLCVKHVKYYLRRAGKVQGLHLSLAEPSSSSWTPPAPAENKWTLAIFRLWIPEAHRWRSIRFDFRNTPPIPEIINLSPGSLNKVTSFSLRTEWPDSVVEQFWDKVHTSPALREVEWRFPLTPNSAPLVQLTSIDMPGHILSCTEFLALLSSCNKLRRIEVIVDPATEAEARSITCVTLAGCLEMLLLHSGPGEVEFGLLLDYIKAPNLRELEVEVSRSDRAVLRRFLCQSGCSLRRLWLRTNNFTYSEDHLLDSLLDAAPYLTSVEVCRLHHSVLSSRTLSALATQIANSILLPSVISLTLMTMGHVPEGILGDMLVSRARSGALPQMFIVLFTRNNKLQARDKEIISRLEVHNGLRADCH